jgi:hypothetical protein
MKRIAAAALALLLAVDPATALACRCIKLSPAAAYRNAEVVVRAKVLAFEGDINGKAGATAKISVSKAWKDDVAREIQVFTHTTCASSFEVGADYLLYLQKAPPTGFVTNRCFANLRTADAAKAIAWLDRHGKPREVRAGP